jgi:hypothetical protein
MLIITSPGCIEKKIQLSMDDDCAVAKNTFYLEAKPARTHVTNNTQEPTTYIVLPYELVSILRGCNFIAVKGYKLQEDNGHYKAVQSKESGVDLIVNGKVYVNTRTDYPVEFDIGSGHKLIMSGATALIGADGSTIICEKDLTPEYEGTPAECYRFAIPTSSAAKN